MQRPLLLLGVLLVAACAAGNQDPGEGVSADESNLVVGQIKDIGFFWPSDTRNVDYTGERRYVGTKIDAPEGARILLHGHIARGMKQPVAVIADEQLNVLAREVGGTVSGAPGHSFVRAEILAPRSGKYWVLWGEESRQRFALEISYGVKRSAGVECHHDNMCISESCQEHRCAKTTFSQYPALCIVNSDCTSDRCDGYLCQKRWNGDACAEAAECMQDVCAAGVCSCIEAGGVASSPQQCCSRSMSGEVCQADPGGGER